MNFTMSCITMTIKKNKGVKELTKNLHEKLTIIQNEMKVPKSNYNSFGKYYYRSCSDILEEAKGHLQEHKLTLYITDEVTTFGEGDSTRFYIKSIATLTDNESGESISVSAFAREPLNKKGQDESQVTGSSSTYARKYALNGLFAIDDTKDADADEYANESSARATYESKGSSPKTPQNSPKQAPEPKTTKDNSTQPSGDIEPLKEQINDLTRVIAPHSKEAEMEMIQIFTSDFGTTNYRLMQDKDVEVASTIITKLEKLKEKYNI